MIVFEQKTAERGPRLRDAVPVIECYGVDGGRGGDAG